MNRFRFSWQALKSVLAAPGLMAGVALPVVAADPVAATATPEAGTPLVSMKLYPAAAPAAVLKYRLLPPITDMHAGNSAMIYARRGMTVQSKELGDTFEKVHAWLAMPLDKLPRDEARTFLASYRDLLNDLDLAARRSDCDWQLPIGERNLFTLILPEVQACRTLFTLLRLQLRLQLAEGQSDDALRGLQTGLAMAQHVSRGPTIIHGLVGAAMSNVLLEDLRELIQQPGTPNLYWALTTLPQPLINLRQAIETEANMLDLSYPELRELQTGRRSATDWPALMERISGDLNGITGITPLGSKLMLTGIAMQAYPEAKQRMIAAGRPAAEVDALPVFQVVMTDTLATYAELRDRITCWFYVPYWQARPHMEAAEKYLQTEGRRRETIPLASLLLPAMQSVSLAVARTDREVALLRTIEALRMHAAAHDGQLPDRLSDVTLVPVPIDPVSGQEFEYHLQDGRAMLSTAPGQNDRERTLRPRFELQIHQ